ncbi:septum formation initiator family protein [Neobacillus sp. FSL H8-0543]|uniref:FtsB family cell division protein n=1 Tax=Neobacillus sp. FSL H8-0543 TaxID=2954672 RepID=UPI0031580025
MNTVREKSIAKIQTTYVKQKEVAEIASARKRKLLLRRLSMFFVLAVVVSYFMISSYIFQTSALDTKMAQKGKLDEELAELQKQQQVLKEDIIKLNDDDYIAKLARKEYFFSDNNEVIFTIPEKN